VTHRSTTRSQPAARTTTEDRRRTLLDSSRAFMLSPLFISSYSLQITNSWATTRNEKARRTPAPQPAGVCLYIICVCICNNNIIYNILLTFFKNNNLVIIGIKKTRGGGIATARPIALSFFLRKWLKSQFYRTSLFLT
jgi:hypothetical protein